MERKTNSLQEVWIYKPIGPGVFGHREKLGWGGRPEDLSCPPPSHGARLGAALEGVTTKTHRIVPRPCRHRVSDCFLFGFCVPFNNVKSLRSGSLSLPPTPNCQFSVHQASETSWT